MIIGGGFAGTTLVQALDGRLPDGVELLLISEESHTTFNPMLPEVVGASIFPEQVVAPIRQMLSRAHFIMGRVTALNSSRRALTCTTLAGEREIGYEHLVLAFGNRARLDLLPGLADHALPLKTVGDAMHIRNVVLRRLARIELEDAPDMRRALGHFVVIGGGFSGVEVAGELVDCLKSIRRYYPRTNGYEPKITLLQDLPRLLPELPEKLGRAAHRSLAKRGVVVRTGVRAAAISDRGVRLADGEFIAANTVLCTIGTQPNPLVERSSFTVERGRIVVGADLSVPDASGVWAIGDCALIRNARDKAFAPPTAQFAIAEARCLARNLLSVLQGGPTSSFNYRSRGSIAAIGHRKGVGSVFGLQLSGLPAWLLWRAYYLSKMPTLGRKVRIFVEWTWGMFFPNDITHLRFIRSAELDSPTHPSTPSPLSESRPNVLRVEAANI